MARSTSEQGSAVERAHHLCKRGISFARSEWRLSREFDLSGRQAYRYLEQATQLDRPVEVSSYGADDAQLPRNGTSSSGVCEKQ